MKRILIVDDSAFVAKLLRRVIESLGHTVVDVAGDGREGFQAFQKHDPDIVLLDVTMPNVDGLECLGMIRQAEPQAKVIMISAVRTPETIQQCFSAGAVAFLQKPIRPDSEEDIARLSDALDTASSTEPDGAAT